MKLVLGSCPRNNWITIDMVVDNNKLTKKEKTAAVFCTLDCLYTRAVKLFYDDQKSTQYFFYFPKSKIRTFSHRSEYLVYFTKDVLCVALLAQRHRRKGMSAARSSLLLLLSTSFSQIRKVVIHVMPVA